MVCTANGEKGVGGERRGEKWQKAIELKLFCFLGGGGVYVEGRGGYGWLSGGR